MLFTLEQLAVASCTRCRVRRVVLELVLCGCLALRRAILGGIVFSIAGFSIWQLAFGEIGRVTGHVVRGDIGGCCRAIGSARQTQMRVRSAC